MVGAGPVGLTMAGELARNGIVCRIIDGLQRPSTFCRAIGDIPRTLEIWGRHGIAREMIDAGIWLKGLRSIVEGRCEDLHLECRDLPYGHLGLPQYETERLLTRHLNRYGVDVERGILLTNVRQDEDHVMVDLQAATATHASFRYVIGCDGVHSTVRHALGIAFEGDAFPMTFMLGDVHIDWQLPPGMSFRALRLVPNGPPDMFIAIPLPECGRYRVSMLAPPGVTDPGDKPVQSELQGPELEDLARVARDLVPANPTLSDLRWSSIFRISMRLASHYRKGRVFIAGDAAHIHPPTGGQGMNTGIQDAYNLAWKLASVLKGVAPTTLLDSYEAERRPVGAHVVARTRDASIGYAEKLNAVPISGSIPKFWYPIRELRGLAPNGWPDARPGRRRPSARRLRA